jgi:hypothetical protein
MEYASRAYHRATSSYVDEYDRPLVGEIDTSRINFLPLISFITLTGLGLLVTYKIKINCHL